MNESLKTQIEQLLNAAQELPAPCYAVANLLLTYSKFDGWQLNKVDYTSTAQVVVDTIRSNKYEGQHDNPNQILKAAS
jgi:hypothetical protein